MPVAVFATSYQVDIVASVPGCGDEIIQNGEQCDGANLGGSTCSYLGFTSGVLSCSSVCTLVTAACVLTPVTSSQSQMISTKGDVVESVSGSNLVITGYYAPFSRVSLLKDGRLAATVFTNEQGFFQLTLSGLAVGEYLLKLVAEGTGGRLVVGESFTGKVYQNLTTMISAVYLPPDSRFSIEGNVVQIIGRSVPDSVILIEQAGILNTYKADSRGDFSVSLVNDIKTTDNKFRVGIQNDDGVVWGEWQDIATDVDFSTCDIQADITNDCRVNFVDFAITLWWYLYNPTNATIDFDKNGKLDLVDFSIMAYYWTG